MLHPSKKRASSFRRAAVVSVLAGTLVLAALASCGEGSHPYGARLFDRTRSCLGPVQSIDVVSGDDPGSNCALKCLVPRTGASAGNVYVSLQCPPYPPDFDTSGVQPGCDAALAALERGDFCLADGGSTQPHPDAGSAPDAETDSGMDASDANDTSDANTAFDANEGGDGNVTDT